MSQSDEFLKDLQPEGQTPGVSLTDQFIAENQDSLKRPPVDVKVPPGFEAMDRVSPFGFLQSALADYTAGPFVGLAESAGLVTEGTRDILREEHEKNRLDFFAQSDPGNHPHKAAAKFGFAAGAETIAMMLPLAPSIKVAQLVVGNILPRTAPAAVGALLRGGVAAGTEGAIVAAGDTVGIKDPKERLKVGAQIFGLATAMGIAGGGASIVSRMKRLKSRGNADSFRKEHISNDPSDHPGGIAESRGLFRRMTDALSDDKDPILRIGRRATPSKRKRAKYGTTAPSDPTSTRLGRLVHRLRISRKAAGNAVFRAPQIWDGEKFIRFGDEGLAHILQDLPKGGYDDLGEYLAVRRELELGARAKDPKDRVRVYDETQIEALNGLQRLSDKYGTDASGRINVLEDAARRYQDWSQRAILAPAHAVGIINDTQLAHILGKNEHHAYFHRLRETLFRPQVEGKPFHTIERGLKPGEKILDPIQEAAFMSMRISEMVDRQLVRQELVGIARRSPELVPELKRAKKRPRKMNVRLDKKERERLGIPEASKDKTFQVMRMVDATEADGAFPVYVNGKRELWRTTDASLMRSLEGLKGFEAKLALTMGEKMAHGIKLVAAAPARTLRAGALTTLGFIQRNPIRDNFTAFVNSRHGFIPFYDPVATGVRELFKFSTTGEHSKMWSDFIDSGTMGSSLAGLDRMTAGAELRAVKRLGVKGKVRRFMHEIVRNPIYPMQVLRDLSESLTRASEFGLATGGGRKRVAGLPIPGTKGRGKKVTTLQASHDSAEVSLDFSRAGTVGRVWNSYEPFINAEIQDFSKFFRNIKEQPVGAVVRAVTAITLPTLAVWARWRGDEDYEKLPAWSKRMFYQLSKNEDGSFVQIPRPLGMLNAMYGLTFDAAARYLDDQDPKAADALADAIIEETPVGMLLDPIINRSFGRPLSSITPAVLDPIVENYFNYDTYFEREIVPRRLQKEFPERQFTSSTPKLAIGAGKALGVSPLKVQNLIEGYIGTLGVDLVRSAGILLAGERAVPLDPQVGLRGTPFIGSAIRATRSTRQPMGLRSKFVNDIFEMADLAEKSNNEWNSMVEEGESDEVLMRYLAEHPEAIFLDMLKAEARWIGEQATLRREILEEGGIPEEERMHVALQLDEVIDVVSAEAMKAMTAGILKTRVDMLAQLGAK